MLERWSPTRRMMPWRSFSSLGEFDTILEDFLRIRPPTLPLRRVPQEEVIWSPAVEVLEKDNQFIVRAEIPGLHKEDIQVSIQEDALVIEGERKAKAEFQEDEYCRCEMSYGKFSRSLALPSSVDKSKVEAHYEEGILEVRMPEIQQPQAERIQVSVH